MKRLRGCSKWYKLGDKAFDMFFLDTGSSANSIWMRGEQLLKFREEFEALLDSGYWLSQDNLNGFSTAFVGSFTRTNAPLPVKPDSLESFSDDQDGMQLFVRERFLNCKIPRISRSLFFNAHHSINKQICPPRVLGITQNGDKLYSCNPFVAGSEAQKDWVRQDVYGHIRVVKACGGLLFGKMGRDYVALNPLTRALKVPPLDISPNIHCALMSLMRLDCASNGLVQEASCDFNEGRYPMLPICFYEGTFVIPDKEKLFFSGL
ncbi:hypothetical protein SELMODRAFT_404535 [Selaginella moellendorffii]|uniref:Uncharacterized protein n=1 Tax=Selaginella moellendorffii TaxID=88036 RepID=D8QVN1_SELML|nr:hypothetical protein SELMODRAFT_404535 [Selaginella moellendorffii]